MDNDSDSVSKRDKDNDSDSRSMWKNLIQTGNQLAHLGNRFLSCSWQYRLLPCWLNRCSRCNLVHFQASPFDPSCLALHRVSILGFGYIEFPAKKAPPPQPLHKYVLVLLASEYLVSSAAAWFQTQSCQSAFFQIGDLPSSLHSKLLGLSWRLHVIGLAPAWGSW